MRAQQFDRQVDKTAEQGQMPSTNPAIAHPGRTYGATSIVLPPAQMAATLRRTTGGQLARTGQSLLQLQRRHGNHYVQWVVQQMLASKVGHVLDHQDLKSMKGLEGFQKDYGGTSQGTLAFVHASDSNYYMIEQETNNRVSQAARARDINYIPQGRESGYHAEIRFIDWAKPKGVLRGSSIWVSKPICADCAEMLRNEGALIKTPVDEDTRYHNWKAPKGWNREVSSSGTFRGRRSETERLMAEWPKDMDRTVQV